MFVRGIAHQIVSSAAALRPFEAAHRRPDGVARRPALPREVTVLACVAVALFASSSPATQQTAPTPDGAKAVEATEARAPDAAAEYDRLGEAFQRLEEEHFGGAATAASDDRATYLATGVESERVARWLARARELGSELVRADLLPYRRTVMLSDGYTPGPAYLAPLRAAGRSTAILVQDAAIRSDAKTLGELLRVQVSIATRTGSDGTLPTSMLAVVAAEEHLASVAELLDRCAIDPGIAKEILDARRAFIDHADFGLIAAARAEVVALQAEVDRLLQIPSGERPDFVAGVRGNVRTNFDDTQLLAARTGSDVYLSEAAEALEDNDLEGARLEIAALQERLRDGAFGDLLRVLAPQLLPTIDMLIETHGDLTSQRTTLEAIAAGTEHPAVHADAGRLYMRAARACAAVPADVQVAVEELRAGLLATDSKQARRAIEAIDAHRADVIQPLLDAARSNRCTLPTHPVEVTGGGLMRTPAIGLNGAVRMLLADAFMVADQADSGRRHDAVAAALHVIAHLSSLGTYSHSLVAQQVARDLELPLAQLRERGEIDGGSRDRLVRALRMLDPADPFGFRRAFANECTWLAAQTFTLDSRAIAAFERTDLLRLDPDGLGFLLAMFTPAPLLPFDLKPGSALEGAMVDIRPWFDVDAYRRAHEQAPALRDRMLRTLSMRDGAPRDSGVMAQDRTPLAWLDVTKPVGIVARTNAADAEYARMLDAVGIAAEAARSTTAVPDDGD